MPKLLIFAPCDKVIVSEQDNTTSLISIIEGFTIDIPEGAALPEDSVIPIKWHVLSLWEKLNGEENMNFEQRIDLVLPNDVNRLNLTSTIDFTPESNRFRMVTMVAGFPLSPAGACVLKQSVREVGQEAWQEVADYAINVTRPSAQNTEAVNEEPTVENTEDR